VDVEQLTLGDALGVVEQRRGLGTDDAAVSHFLVGFHGQLARIEVRDDHVVLPAGEEHRRAGVALRPAAAQLVVQTLGVVPSRADDVQSAELDHLIMAGFVRAAEPDVGAATGHLGGYRDGSQCAASAMTVASSASFLALSTTAGMPRRSSSVQLFGFGDVLRADQHRAAGVVHLGDVVDDPVDLGGVGDVDPVLFVLADVGRVRLDRRHPSE
jgi:hypothetical protein